MRPAHPTKALNRSLWVFHLNSGSCNGCEIEIVATITPRYDPERFGIKLVGSPRHADVLLVTGPVTGKMDDKIRRIFAQTPDPKLVMAIGACGISGGPFYESYNLTGPIDDVIPVDIYIPGCPPRPEAITFGVVKALEKLEKLQRGGTPQAADEQSESGGNTPQAADEQSESGGTESGGQPDNTTPRPNDGGTT